MAIDSLNNTKVDKGSQQSGSWDDVEIDIPTLEDEEIQLDKELIGKYIRSLMAGKPPLPLDSPDRPDDFNIYEVGEIERYSNKCRQNSELIKGKIESLCLLNRNLQELLDETVDDDPLQGGDEKDRPKDEGPELDFSLPPVNLEGSPFMTLMGNFVGTSGQESEDRVKSRKAKETTIHEGG